MSFGQNKMTNNTIVATVSVETATFMDKWIDAERNGFQPIIATTGIVSFGERGIIKEWEQTFGLRPNNLNVEDWTDMRALITKTVVIDSKRMEAATLYLNQKGIMFNFEPTLLSVKGDKRRIHAWVQSVGTFVGYANLP